MAIPSVDLTQRPPRSVRATLGGYVILPRILDKCRALLAGKLGEYKYDCPNDQHFFSFVGITGDELKKVVAEGKGDGEILEWVNAHARIKRTQWEIATWSAFLCTRAPAGAEMKQFVAESLQQIAPKRADISTWFEWLDLDDYVTFGGKA